MYLAHLVLTSASCPAPTQADAQRLQDGLWARAPRDLGIEHIHARAGPGHVDVVVFFRSAAADRPAPGDPAREAVRNLPLPHGWHAVLTRPGPPRPPHRPGN